MINGNSGDISTIGQNIFEISNHSEAKYFWW